MKSIFLKYLKQFIFILFYFEQMNLRTIKIAFRISSIKHWIFVDNLKAATCRTSLLLLQLWGTGEGDMRL